MSISTQTYPTVEQLKSPEFWRELCPELHIESIDQSIDLSTETQLDDEGRQRLVQDGYAYCPQVISKDMSDRLVRAIERLASHRLYPVFIAVYDEIWLILNALSSLFTEVLGERYAILPDIWAWSLGPNDKGWGPHRDRLVPVLRDDGHPNSITVWVALSNASPDNGCMYILPASKDPNYPNNPQMVVDDWQAVRALPANAGDVLIWNQTVAHWGGQCSAWAKENRVSVAFELQRCDVPELNSPLLSPDYLPPFEWRLGIIAKQLLQYEHMISLEPELKRMAAVFRPLLPNTLP